jgi:hypothetical protein
MAGPDEKMGESGGMECGREKRTEFCLEIAEEKGGSSGDELDDPGRRGHIELSLAQKGEINYSSLS